MPEQSDYLDAYREAVQRFGPTFDSTLWRSRETQRIRFEVLRSLVDLDGLRLLDAGCGLGDLAEYLSERNVRLSRYIGLDGLPALIDRARQRGLARTEFHVGDFVQEPALLRTGAPDIIFFSGSLNTVAESRAREVVAAAFEAAQRGVVFNFLSDRCGPRSHADLGPARRFNTLDWLDWALQTTVRVRFRQDYLDGHDATIAMLR